MDREEFQAQILENSIDFRSFSLGKDIDLKMCMIQIDVGDWSVFYSEKGKKWSEKIFARESDALMYLFQELKNDKSSTIEFWKNHTAAPCGHEDI